MPSEKDVDAAFVRGLKQGEEKEKIVSLRSAAFRRKVKALIEAALPGCKTKGCERNAHFIVIPKDPKKEVYHVCAKCQPEKGSFYIKQRLSYSAELSEVEDG